MKGDYLVMNNNSPKMKGTYLVIFVEWKESRDKKDRTNTVHYQLTHCIVYDRDSGIAMEVGKDIVAAEDEITLDRLVSRLRTSNTPNPFTFAEQDLVEVIEEYIGGAKLHYGGIHKEFRAIELQPSKGLSVFLQDMVKLKKHDDGLRLKREKMTGMFPLVLIDQGFSYAPEDEHRYLAPRSPASTAKKEL